MFLAGVAQLPRQFPKLVGLGRRAVLWPVVFVVLFLIWLCISAAWSPADTALITGSIREGNFSVDAPQIRFGLTVLAAGSFLWAALQWEPGVRTKLPAIMLVSTLLLLAGLLAISPFRQTIIEAQGAGLWPSAQSAGRAVNLLALCLPLAVGLIMARFEPTPAIVTSALIIALLVMIAVRMGGAAVVIALLAAPMVFCVLNASRDLGWKWLFYLLGAAVLTAPLFAHFGTSALSDMGQSLPVSAHQRLLIWQETVARIAEKPLFGHGADAATSWHGTFSQRPDWLSLMPDNFALVRIIPGHPHNMALQIWAETGLVGACLIAGGFASLGRSLPPPASLRIEVRLAAAGVFSVAATLFFVSYSAWDESYWAALAIIASSLIVIHKFCMRST
ncbi:MAG: O-antigen ligase family protein [Pseudomonadota bacterium]